MRLGLFPWFAGGTVGGCEVYELNLVHALARIDRDNEYRVYCLDQRAMEAFSVGAPRFRSEALRPRSRWLSIPVTLPLRLLLRPLDLLHATTVPPPFTSQRYVLTMHCTSSFEHPQFYPPGVRLRLNALLRRGLRGAAHILCVSEHVRQRTAERFGIPSERLSVVHHGVAAGFRPLPSAEARAFVAERWGLRTPYLLSVGWLESRKNVVRILEAFRAFLAQAGADARLVFAGRRHWEGNALDAELERLGLRRHVVEVGHVDHADLPRLYAAARMLVFPSLWEGFGMPVVEAMACGTPVITSKTSSLPEVAGGAALLVDPLRIDEIAQAMTRLWNDEALCLRLRESGLVRARDFSWERAARETLSVYERVVARDGLSRHSDSRSINR